MIDPIQISTIQGTSAKGSPRQSRDPISQAPAEPDATLQIQHGDQIAKAVASDPADADAVQAAEKLLASGEIDSRQSARQAAEDLVDFGV